MKTATEELKEALHKASLHNVIKALGRLTTSKRANFPPPTTTVCVLRNHTVDNLVWFLQAAAELRQLTIECALAPFDQLMQVILDPASILHKPQAEIVILSLVLEPFTNHDSNFTVSELITRLSEIIQALRDNTSAILVLNTFLVPVVPTQGISTARNPSSLEQKIRQLNEWLFSICQNDFRIFLLDFNQIEAQLGSVYALDWRMWYAAKSILTNKFLVKYAIEITKIVCALKGRSKKCLVLDADNCLWGGVIGEDGLEHILLNPTEYPGNIYYEVQKLFLALHDRGILLCICSTNNEADVWEVLEKHPHCLINRRHIAAWRINWLAKPDNLISLAAELRLDLDSFVFLDDSSLECGLVSQTINEVDVIQVPKHIWEYPEILIKEGLFDTLSDTPEDHMRTQMYLSNSLRAVEERKFAGAEDFLRTLDMIATIKLAAPNQISRIAQLTQKTNQFNLTTHRYSEIQIEKLIRSNEHEVVCLTVADRFGDFGLVGVAILWFDNNVAEFDTLLLSCRILGRNVENVFLVECINYIYGRGIDRVKGTYIPSLKNAQTKLFYSHVGFTQLPTQTATQYFELQLTQPITSPHSYIEVRR